MDNNTKAKKVTLRPTQLNKVLRIAKKDYDSNFSLALRVMIDKFEDGTCESCVEYCSGTGYCPVKNHTVESDDICKHWRKDD